MFGTCILAIAMLFVQTLYPSSTQGVDSSRVSRPAATPETAAQPNATSSTSAAASQPIPSREHAATQNLPSQSVPKAFSRNFGTVGEMIKYENGRLTLKVLNRATDTIVGLVTMATEVPIVDIQGALNRHAVSLDFHDLPLDEALKLVLKDYDTFFLYGSDGHRPNALQHVWVFPNGKGRDFDPVPFEACASSKELRAAIRSKDVAAKGRALENLLAREGDKARDVVMQMLSSAAPEDRNLALYYAAENGIEISTSTLNFLALGDSLPANRVMALDALVGAGPDVADPVLQSAMTDPDSTVREEAKQLMEQLHPSAVSRPSTQGQQVHQ